MAAQRPHYHAPIFLGAAFFVFGIAILQKVLSLFHTNIPLMYNFPRTLLDWAVALIMFEIALSVRQLIELMIEDRGKPKAVLPPDVN